MFEKFSQYLQDKAVFTIAELNRIEAVSQIVSIAKNEVLMQEGTPWIYNVFVCSGLMRSFTVDLYGNECTTGFSPENYWTGDRESLMNGTPARFNIDAIEDAEVILIEKTNFDKLCKNIPQLNDLVNAILQRSFIVSQNRIQANISYTAEEKYQHFLDKFPSIANRIPQHMIASYIGITPETITRIRRAASKK